MWRGEFCNLYRPQSITLLLSRIISLIINKDEEALGFEMNSSTGTFPLRIIALSLREFHPFVIFFLRGSVLWDSVDIEILLEALNMSNQFDKFDFYSRTIKHVLLFTGLWPSTNPSTLYRMVTFIHGSASLLTCCALLNFAYQHFASLHLFFKGFSLALTFLIIMQKVIERCWCKCIFKFPRVSFSPAKDVSHIQIVQVLKTQINSYKNRTPSSLSRQDDF